MPTRPHPTQFLSLRESRRVVNAKGTERHISQSRKELSGGSSGNRCGPNLAAQDGKLPDSGGISEVIFSPKSLTRRIDGDAGQRYSQPRYRIWSLTPSRRFLRHFRATAQVCLRPPGLQSSLQFRPQFNRNYALIIRGRHSDAPPCRSSHPISMELLSPYLPMSTG